MDACGCAERLKEAGSAGARGGDAGDGLAALGLHRTHVCAQGNKKPRLDGDEHMAVVEEFVMAASQKWPNCLIQFEDFQTDKAFAILDRFRDKCLCFNGASACGGSLLYC